MSQTDPEDPSLEPEEPPPVVPEVFAPLASYPPRAEGYAIASLLLGLAGMGAWILPCAGLPVAFMGLVLGILGCRGPGRKAAIGGIILCSLGLAVTLANAAVTWWGEGH